MIAAVRFAVMRQAELDRVPVVGEVDLSDPCVAWWDGFPWSINDSNARTLSPEETAAHLMGAPAESFPLNLQPISGAAVAPGEHTETKGTP